MFQIADCIEDNNLSKHYRHCKKEESCTSRNINTEAFKYLPCKQNVDFDHCIPMMQTNIYQQTP